MWNQRERQHAITKSPMSVQHSSAMFITKNGPTTRLISINSWLWQLLAWHMSWPTWVELECKSVGWFKPNHWISSVSQVDIPSPIPSASSLRSRWNTPTTPGEGFHRWMHTSGLCTKALQFQGRTNGLHTYLFCDSSLSVCTATQVVTWHPLLPGLRPKDAHGTDKGYVKEQSDAQAHVVAIPSEVSCFQAEKKPSFCKPMIMKVWRPFGVFFQTWMCFGNPIADLILYYWLLHLFTQSVELRSFWVNHLSIGSLRIRWLPKSPCNPRHSMCPLFRSFGINWPEPLLRAQLAAPNVRHPNVNGVG